MEVCLKYMCSQKAMPSQNLLDRFTQENDKVDLGSLLKAKLITYTNICGTHIRICLQFIAHVDNRICEQ